jgi:hypothetical protein
MNPPDEWSPDQPQGTETFEQGDEAFDEADRLDPAFLEAVEGDPSIDPVHEVDEVELEEAGVELDDPEVMVTLDGGGDDPDGIGGPSGYTRVAPQDEQGWDLDGSDSAEDDDVTGT